jgi:hypothetical protein
MGGYCKCAYKTSDSITDGEFLGYPSNYQVLKDCGYAVSYLVTPWNAVFRITSIATVLVGLV